MSRRKRGAIVAVLAVAAGALLVPIVLAGPDSSATVRYGNLKAGSPFPPAEHDSSFNAEDNLIPRTVVISRGGSVSFTVDGFHQAAVYGPGTTPEDIEVPPFGPPADPNFDNILVNDGEGRVFLGPSPLGPPVAPHTTPAGTFSEPGKYLMICNVTPHFAFANMYGWVIVK